MSKWLLGVWLGIQAGVDLKYKEVSLGAAFAVAALGVGGRLLEGRNLGSLLLAFIPGILLLLFSKITKEMIGYGDGFVLLVMGCYLSWRRVTSILFLAFGTAGIAALILLLFFKKKGNYRMPFVPFLFLAFLLDCGLSAGGVSL